MTSRILAFQTTVDNPAEQTSHNIAEQNEVGYHMDIGDTSGFGTAETGGV